MLMAMVLAAAMMGFCYFVSTALGPKAQMQVIQVTQVTLTELPRPAPLIELPKPPPPPPPQVVSPPKPLPVVIPKPPPVASRIVVATKPPPVVHHIHKTVRRPVIHPAPPPPMPALASPAPQPVSADRRPAGFRSMVARFIALLRRTKMFRRLWHSWGFPERR